MMAQGAKRAPAPKQGGSYGYCLYSQGTGPVDSSLMVAIWRGDTEAVHRLLGSGAELNVLFRLDCDDGNEKLRTTPLINAIEAAALPAFRSRLDMLELLLNHGADPNFRAPQGISPLQMAASLGEIPSDVTKILLQHGARVDDQNKGGETALLIASQRKNGLAVIRELVAAGANIYATNNLGHNAVMLAAWQHYKDNVKILVDLGVPPCAVDNDGKTAIDQARTNLNEDPGKQEIIAFLQEKCGRQ